MRVMKRAFSILGYSAAALFVLALLFAGLTQTSFFKNRLRIILASEISQQINGTIILGAIDGNFLTGVTIDSVAIYQGDDIALTSGKIAVSYDILRLIRGEFDLSHVIVERPSINLRRGVSGSWNISTLMKPRVDTSQKDWTGTVTLADVQLKNGAVTLYDSTATHAVADTSDHAVDYGNFTIRDLNFQLTGRLRAREIAFTVPHMSFYSPESGLELTHLKGTFLAKEGEISAQNVIVQTGHSYVELDASLRGVNPFRGIRLASMKEDSVRLRLKAGNVDLAELQSLLPALGFLRGSASLDLEAAGEFGKLNVQHLNLRTYRSSLNLSGSVQNLHDPRNLTLNVIAGDSKIQPSDLSLLMPEFGIPAFAQTGTASFSTEFSGRPLDFKAVATLKGPFGAVEVRGSLDLTKPHPVYNATFLTDRLSFQDVIGDTVARGFLTSRGSVAGEGFTLDDITGTLDMDIDSSRINAMTLGASHVHVDAAGKLFKVVSTLHDREMTAVLRGEMDWTVPEHPALSGDLDLQNVNLASILNDRRFESSITLRGTVRGTGRTAADVSGMLKVHLLPSTVGSHELPAQEVTFTLDQHDGANKRLSLTSDVADIDLKGMFNLDLAGTTIARQSVHLVNAIREHALPPDSSEREAAGSKAAWTHSAETKDMNFTYIVHVKDLGSISSLVEGPQFDAKADLAGSIRGNEDTISFSCNGTIHHFFVGNIGSGIIFNEANISLEVNPITREQTLERLSGSLSLNIGSCFVNGRTVDSVRLGLRYDKLRGDLALNGLVDSVLSVSMDGQTSVQPNTYVFDVDHLVLGKDQYVWRNNQDVQVRLNHEGVRVLHAVMQRGSEEVSVAGILRHTGEFDMEAEAHNYDLRGVNLFIHDLRRAQEGQGFSGRADATLLLAGTTASPSISFTLKTDSTFFRHTRIGQVNATISYASELATIDLVANEIEKDTIPDLAVRGTVPINLAFSGVDRRFPDKEQHLSVRSAGFDVSVLDPLIWELDRLSGQLTCDMMIGGTPQSPDYRGTISLHDLHFLFKPNNVAYTAEGAFEPSGDKLLLKNLVVKNVPEDRVKGEARFEGSMTIKDYTLSTFDITMYGNLLVMTDATRKIIPTMYGTLYAAPDARGLNLSGTLSRPFLSGNLEVLDANIVFPPARLNETSGAKTSLSYVVVDDTTIRRMAPLKYPRNFYSAGDSTVQTVAQRNAVDEPALLDRLRYNLIIETKGTTAVKMIFTPNEELYAEMEGKVSAINDQGTPAIYGEIAISSRSYYNFLKKFDATGSLKFVGPWDNPELNIVATYEGYRQGRISEADAAASTGKDLKTVVTLNIGGTRYEPQLKMSMQVQLTPGGDLTDWSTTAGGGDVQSDAISFILTGKFREDLTSGERAGIAADVGASTTTSVVSGFTSNLLSGILDNFVRKEFPFIRSVDVSYKDGTPTVNVGASPGLGYLRVGGRILNSINSTNVSYQVSMGDIFNSTTIRNLFLEIQRRVESDLTGANREDITNEARLYYRFSF